MQARPERGLIADAADDEVRVFVLGREKEAGRFDGGVTGLHDLLGGREVLADQDVNVFYLRHDGVLL